eukprot:CAMPEP_0115010388 /NCGR_PEP_ID=MMETSP0216-20121206/23287_1 /TAXON_ID=223996 /ORGANISM="Protocruzia adherens, Strain Boccale" /LENGTH=624 /DNA_ID=CAMNT_0002378595 /DNA_START=28 /DNA_END=1902 /DNA_ORIENTATION=-
MERELELSAVIGFKGTVPNGLLLHPDNEHLIFPLGAKIVVRHIISRTQTFLNGHDNQISVIATSETGKYIASGQKTHMGFQADIIIWDFESRSLLHRLRQHKVLIQSLSFSLNEKYLASAGGQDDNTVVVWEVETGKAVCGAPPSTNVINQIKFFNNCDNKLITVQNFGIKIWSADFTLKKLQPLQVNLGQMKRQIVNVAIDPSDTYAYCGTKTGDVMEISVERALFKRIGPVKKLFAQGVTALELLPNGDILIGSGDGTVAKVGCNDMRIKKQSKVLGSVTSITLTADATHFFCGTSQSNIYWVDADSLTPELRNTCHYERINDIAFPYLYSEVFATCSINDIRVWNSKTRQEILRIQVPNLECICIGLMHDGKSIISGWDDGKIRAFTPQSGKLMYVINDAHNQGVTALKPTSDCTRVVSGGMQGEVRIWKIGRQTQTMEASMKEHRGRVNDIQLRKNDEQAVSASSDGSCIVWDIKSFTRLVCLFESTMFKQVLYHPDESQLLTTGSDRKITYWDCFDGQAIRMLDGSEDGEINALAITEQGEHFVSGGEDKLVRLWGYDEGETQYIGEGHSGTLTKIAVSPDQRTIISVGSEGAIFIWEVPEEVQLARADNEMPTLNNDK